MGDYTISISGTGPHHNAPGNDDADAEKMAAFFIDELKAAGHTVHGGHIVCGQGEDLTPEEIPQAPPEPGGGGGGESGEGG